ncbi:zona pellucida sperm-binding protein 3d.2 [Pimephales promelas]|nr:zona pellucida sperm-binding protein 3d.2 [Pimephales promelas]
MMNGQIMYSNTLRYTPEPQGTVIRAVPLTLNIQCLYNRFHYSYKIGFQPVLREHKFHKIFERRAKFSISVCNASLPRSTQSLVTSLPWVMDKNEQYLIKGKGLSGVQKDIEEVKFKSANGIGEEEDDHYTVGAVSDTEKQMKAKENKKMPVKDLDEDVEVIVGKEETTAIELKDEGDRSGKVMSFGEQMDGVVELEQGAGRLKSAEGIDEEEDGYTVETDTEKQIEAKEENKKMPMKDLDEDVEVIVGKEETTAIELKDEGDRSGKVISFGEPMDGVVELEEEAGSLKSAEGISNEKDGYTVETETDTEKQIKENKNIPLKNLDEDVIVQTEETTAIKDEEGDRSGKVMSVGEPMDGVVALEEDAGSLRSTELLEDVNDDKGSSKSGLNQLIDITREELSKYKIKPEVFEKSMPVRTTGPSYMAIGSSMDLFFGVAFVGQKISAYFLKVSVLVMDLMVFFSKYVYALRAALKHAIDSTSGSELDIRFGEDFEGSAAGSPYLQLPIFQHSRIPLLDKVQFTPKRGSGLEQLPEATKEVLVPRVTVRESSRRRGRSQQVNVVCLKKKMMVQVNKQILGHDSLGSELKLGTCDVSKTTKHYHVFIYDMDQCGSKRQLINKRVTYSNILRYSPEVEPWPIRRAMPFSLPVECHFNRYHYSYKIGYIPQVRFQNYFKPLRTVYSVVLSPRDELWRRLSPTEEYTLGHPMYFQADGPPLAEDKRLFVDSCYVTTSNSRLSMPRFTVIENHGCMIDSMSSRWSRFIQSGQRNVVRFSLDAFLFQGMLGKHLYMHCEISVGSLDPTASGKSCTYNQSTKGWEELYGSNAVCLCCDSTCLSSDLPVSSKVITSEPWIMESDLNIVEEEQTTPFLPEEVGTGFVQIITTPAAEIRPRHFVPVSAVVEEVEEDDKFEETRRTFEE